MHINWYPGHMKKTKELIVENLKVVDLIIEILDARIPISSKNPDIEKLANNKKRIVVLNKVDLIDDKDLKKWEEYFLENKIADHFIAISVEKGTNISELRRVINVIYEEKLEKMKKKGLRKTEVRMMIVGIPNVGKSKFINRFSNKTKAKVANTPGFTKGKQWIKMDKNTELLDTPGVLWPKFEDNDVAHNLAITGSIKDHVLPIEEVAMKLNDKMKKLGKIDYLVRSYGLTDYLVGKDIMELEPYEILEVLEERLIIAKKEEHNYEKVARVVLRDYRSGKIGKFFLEMPAIK